MMLPAPPADGGFLVLPDRILNNLDLLCTLRRMYPRTKLYAERKQPGFVLHPEQANDIRGLSREARRVMSIGNPPAGPSGMVGYHMRRNDDGRGALRLAMDKLKARI